MKEPEMNNTLQAKVEDFRRYGFIMLCLSVFLYLGTLISMNEGTVPPEVTVIFTLILLIGSAICFSLSVKYKKQANE